MLTLSRMPFHSWTGCTGAKVGDIQNVLGVLYSSTIFQGNFNYMTVLPVVAYERAVFYRERSASMYAAGPHSSATGKPAMQPLRILMSVSGRRLVPIIQATSFAQVGCTRMPLPP